MVYFHSASLARFRGISEIRGSERLEFPSARAKCSQRELFTRRGRPGLPRPAGVATHELLAYLALHTNGASRDELIEAIWPAQDPARTRPRFWQSVTEARKALGDAWVHQGERYQLDRSKVRVDLDDLDRLLTAASSDDAEPGALKSALALWRGEPLEGSDHLWTDGEIRSLRATLLDLLE